jgi:serralysin
MADTVPGDVSSLVSLAIGASVDGAIDTLGDHDWYRVSLVAGQTYTFRTAATGTGDVGDTTISLRDAAGLELAFNDDFGASGLYSQITFTATTSGFYFIDVGAFNNGVVGNFRLSAATSAPLPPDAVPGDATTTATLAIGSAVSGIVNTTGDHDWFKVTLVAGQTYVFRTSASSSASGDVDTFLTLRDAAGTSLLTNDDGGGGVYSAIRFTATTSGTYFLDVGAYNDGSTGNFNLAAAVADPLTVFTNDQIANQLVNGYWGGAGTSRHFNVAPGGTLTVNISGLTPEGQNLARAAFSLWSDATGIVFAETLATAQITIDDAATGASTGSSRTGNIISSATINIGTAWLASYGTTLNSYSFQTYIHEIGHALGLGHGGNYNGTANYTTDALYLNDSWSTTIMSYFDQLENTYTKGLGFTRQYTVSPMVADILAVTTLYGTSTTTRTGDTRYGFGNTSGRAIYDAAANPNVSYTIIDNGGIDTLDYSGFGSNLIDLNAEAFSNIGGRVGNVSIARGSVIENAIGGSGIDTIIGNNVANRLEGGGGNDSLYGGGGSDTLVGGIGNDRLVGGAGLDTAIFSVSATAASIVRLAHGSVLIRTGIDGLDITRSVESATFSDVTVQLRGYARADANGDGASDVYFFSQSTGSISRYDITNGTVGVVRSLGDTGTGSWDVQATGDFNGDANADVVLKNQASGQFYVWTVQNGIQTGGFNLGFIGTSWDVASSGDFNADGQGDILWRNNATGQVYIWDLDARGNILSSANLGVLGTDWTVAQTGDFNRDGYSDVLLRNSTTGQLYLYLIQNGVHTGYQNVGVFGSDWKISAVGDFNGDQISDIAIKNTVTGQFDLLLMNDAQSYNRVSLGTIGTSWDIAATGDYNQDGTDDLLWRNADTGLVYIWTIEDGHQAASGSGSVGTLTADQILI